MMSFNCKECQLDFDTKRGLHAHIKKHGHCLGDYYVKYYARRDKLTNELLPFIKYDDYFTREFSHLPNRDKWLKTAPREETQKYLCDLIKGWVKKRGIDYGPSDLELLSADLPGVDTYKEHFGSYTDVCERCGVVPRLKNPLPKNFFKDYAETHILIDTREKQPLAFANSSLFKLDVGDYSVKADKFKYTFVDRKSFPDFCISVTASYDRFAREMDRCREMGCYMFVVIEIEYQNINKFNRQSYKKHNLGYVLGNMRKLQAQYSDCVQFVFGGSRAYSALLIPKLLCLGDEAWGTDINYFWAQFLENQKLKKNHGLGGW